MCFQGDQQRGGSNEKPKFTLRVPGTYIEELILMVISYEIYETSLGEFHKFHMKLPGV